MDITESGTKDTERLEEIIELFDLNHRDICFFGAEGDCDEMCYEKIEYCALGKYRECEGYQKKLDRLR